MSLDRSWQDEWGRTWLSDSEFTTALDGWVRRRMIEHYEVAERRAELGTLGPWTLDGLVADGHRQAAAGRWLWATTAICLVQELLFCVDDGGVDMSRHLSGDFADEVRTLRYLRNVIVHPAKMPVKTGENSADEFCFRRERDPAFYELAPSLLDNWSLFADHRACSGVTRTELTGWPSGTGSTPWSTRRDCGACGVCGVTSLPAQSAPWGAKPPGQQLGSSRRISLVST